MFPNPDPNPDPNPEPNPLQKENIHIMLIKFALNFLKKNKNIDIIFECVLRIADKI